MAEEAELKKCGAVETVGGDPPPTPPWLGRTFQIGTIGVEVKMGPLIHSIEFKATPKMSNLKNLLDK